MANLFAQSDRTKKDLFNGKNWTAIPRGKAKLWKFEKFEILAVAATCEEVMWYVVE